jgi:hypothetical protein
VCLSRTQEGERKSARLQSLPAVKYDAEAAAEAEARWEAAQGRKRSGRMARAAMDAAAPGAAQEQQIDSVDEAAERSRPAQPAPEAPPGSLRTLDADLAAMHKASLGQLVLPPEGSGALKAAVMGMLRGNVNHPPKHNKYSGIQVRLPDAHRVASRCAAAAARTMDFLLSRVSQPHARTRHAGSRRWCDATSDGRS